jgi:hypothetical protein
MYLTNAGASGEFVVAVGTDDGHLPSATKLEGLADGCSVCTWPGDMSADTWYGTRLQGTTAGNDLKAEWWIFGSDPPANKFDPAAWGAADCTCLDADFDSNFAGQMVDTAGPCGPTGGSVSMIGVLETNLDDFYCGDTP